MREMEDVYLVGLQTPFAKKNRLKIELDKIAYAATPREWVTECPG